MRPKGRNETESLYFTYPHFDAPLDRDHLSDPAPIAIVGAGPIGMTAALGLAREGLASVIFDAKPTFNDGSRAICIARSSMSIFERIGAVAPFLEKSLGWTTGRSFYRGQQILEFEMPDSDQEKYRPMYNLQQQYIEQFLWDAVESEPLIDRYFYHEHAAVSVIFATNLRVFYASGNAECSQYGVVKALGFVNVVSPNHHVVEHGKLLC